ncbi:isoleucine--tRNA ligase [Chloroflexota bacterium]
MFEPVNSRVDLPQVEEKILNLWRDNNVFARSVEARRGAPRFVLYDGPPTANGNPGIHHVLARVFKDVMPRYKAMKGYYTPRIAGWDTHGLPVELDVEKAMGFTSKADIERFGIDQFNARCRESVFTYLKEWNELTERIAFWVDLDNAYVTMDNDYIESVWWAIKQMWDKGLVYQGYRVTPHCPRCGTSLSSHEVALGYKDNVSDPSVYIKFKLAEGQRSGLPTDKSAYFLAWTTTPWTLSGNAALAVAADADYAVVAIDGEYLIMADALREQAGLGDYEVAARLKGGELVGRHYEPLYNVPLKYAEGARKAYRVIAGSFVSMDDGTGLVHIAPAYGETDFQFGQEEGLPLIHTVELDGTVKAVPTSAPITWAEDLSSGVMSNSGAMELPGKGIFVKEADPLVLEDLKARGLLLRSETVRHTYPFCWRCEAPLLYYAKQTWYIRTTAVKEALIAGNDEINWHPEHIKYGRFGDWLQNNVDWAFSRERYWGTPLPVWRCPSCGRFDCVGGVKELESKPGFSGFPEPMDLHRPFVDEVTFNCPDCGDKMKRLPEVIDCWFDSGAMPIAQCHYPFENKALFDDETKQADYICEAVDQTRGWFYSLHAISTLLFNRPSFKNVICLGHILDAKGEKMSKRKGNVVKPWTVINKFGADALRWYCYTSSPPGNVRRFSKDMVSEIVRRVLLTLWNVYSFFITYANIDQFVPLKEAGPYQSDLDRWIISELNQLVADVDAALDSYNPTEAGRKIEGFIDELSNWYVRRSRRRFWKSENDADKLSAYNALYQCLVTLCKLMAPLTPFLAEEIYQNLVRSAFPDAPDSVHLANFPVADMTVVDEQLAVDTRLAMKVSSLGRAARSEAKIKVRQPLPYVLVSVTSPREGESLQAVKPQILEELNVKDVRLVDNVNSLDESSYVVSAEVGYAVAVPTEIPTELQTEGMAREIVHRFQMMRRSAGFDIADHIIAYYQGDDYVGQVIADFANYIKQETLAEQIIPGSPEEGAFTGSYKLSGCDLSLGVKKV